MASYRRAQVPIARGILVDASRHLARPQRTGNDPAPGSMWKQRSVRKPGSEVETRHVEKVRRQRYRLPNATHLNRAGRRSPGFRCRWFRLEMMADKRPRAGMGCRKSFCEKAFIRDRHGRS